MTHLAASPTVSAHSRRPSGCPIVTAAHHRTTLIGLVVRRQFLHRTDFQGELTKAPSSSVIGTALARYADSCARRCLAALP